MREFCALVSSIKTHMLASHASNAEVFAEMWSHGTAIQEAAFITFWAANQHDRAYPPLEQHDDHSQLMTDDGQMTTLGTVARGAEPCIPLLRRL